MPSDGVTVDWWAPPSGARRDARRRPDEDEPRLDVERVDERVQAARDERVVDRADRDQPLAEQLAGQPELAEPQEQVHLADAELDVLRPAGPGSQTSGALDVVAVRAGMRGEDAGAVDPAAEVRRDRDVRRGGHDRGRRSPDRARVPRGCRRTPAGCWSPGAIRMSGIAMHGRLGRFDRAARRVVAELGARGASPAWPPASPAANPAQTSSGSIPRSRPSWSTWSATRCAEWLSASPANGSRQPLMV